MCPQRKNINIIVTSEVTPNSYERALSLNGHKIKGLIDMGSGYTLLRTSVAEKFNVAILSAPNVVLRGFAGQTATSNQSAVCDIQIMNARTRVKAILVPDEYLVHDIVVGRDFIEQEHIIVIKCGKDLLFKQLPAIRDDPKNAIDVHFLNAISEQMLRIGPISMEARQRCIDLIHEYGDCISSSMKDLGRTNAASLSIRCITDVPIVYRPYRLAEIERRVLRDIVNDLLTHNLIRKSSSPYVSPLVLVKKSNSEYRMCVDPQTERDHG